MIYYVRGEKFRLAWIETFGSFWCRCCSQTNSPGGSATVLTDIPLTGSTITPVSTRKTSTVKRQKSQKQLEEAIVEVSNEI